MNLKKNIYPRALAAFLMLFLLTGVLCLFSGDGVRYSGGSEIIITETDRILLTYDDIIRSSTHIVNA
jgi:uncharacterized membrane protein